LTFALSWTVWIAAMAMSGPAVSILRWPVFLLGVFAPAIVALAITASVDGRSEAWSLLRRIGAWRVGTGWYLFAAGYMVAVKLAVAVVYRVATGAWPPFGETPWPIMAFAIVPSTFVQAGEELGWRGYALPRLAARIGLAPASVALGAIWAAWHLPLFFWPQSDTYGQSFPVYVLQVTALSVAMAWLYWRTAGSLLLVMLMHAAINNTTNIVPSAALGASNPFSLTASPVSRLTAGVLWVTAAYFLFRMRGKQLAQGRVDDPIRGSGTGR
jgi:uncharacterized protein